MVDGDRAVVLASQGRTVEAVRAADEVLPLLARPGPGPRPGVGHGPGHHRRHRGGPRLRPGRRRRPRPSGSWPPSARVAELPGRAFDRAQIALARGTLWRASGLLREAEAPITQARRTFLELGCAPAAALAQLEEARLAVDRGYQASSRPLFDRARSEYAALGLRREVVAIDAILAASAP